MTALVLRADLVAPVANMLAAAWAAGGIGAPAQTSVHEAPGKPPAPQAREVSQAAGGSGRPGGEHARCGVGRWRDWCTGADVGARGARQTAGTTGKRGESG